MGTVLPALVQPKKLPVSAAAEMGPPVPTRVERAAADVQSLGTQIAGKQQEQGEFEAEQAQKKAEQLSRQAAQRAEDIGKERKTIEESVPFKDLQQVEKEAAQARFEPTQRSIQENAALFSLIGVLGFAVGAGSKSNAMQAMSALNGMVQGVQAGDMDRYKQEKTTFDTNLKALVQRSNLLTTQVKRITELAARDKEKANLEMDALLAREQAGFVKQYKDKFGLPATIKYLEQQQKDAQQALQMAQRAEDAERKRIEEQQFRLTMQQMQFQHQESMRAANEALRRDLDELRRQGSAKATQQQFIAQRAVTALRGAASTMETVMQLPAGTTAGVLPFLPTKEGMANFVKSAGGRTLSKEEQKAVETLYSGMSRYLATIEASGTATGLVGLANQIEKVYPKAGDTGFDIALKIADTRRIATEAVAAMIESGLLPAQQAKAAQEQIERFEKAVPFTTQDVVQARFGGRPTMGKASTAIATPPPTFATEEEANAANLPKGTVIIVGGRKAVVE